MLRIVVLLVMMCMATAVSAQSGTPKTPALGDFSQPGTPKQLQAWEGTVAAAVFNNTLHLVYLSQGLLYHTQSVDGERFKPARSLGAKSRTNFSPALVVVGNETQSLLLLLAPVGTNSLSYSVFNSSGKPTFDEYVTVPGIGNAGGAVAAAYNSFFSQLNILYASNECADSKCGYTYGYGLSVTVESEQPLSSNGAYEVSNAEVGVGSWYTSQGGQTQRRLQQAEAALSHWADTASGSVSNCSWCQTPLWLCTTYLCWLRSA